MKHLFKIFIFIILLVTFSFANSKNEQFLKAAKNGNLAKVKLLLANGVSIHAKNELGYNAMDYAVFKRRINVINYLIKKGINVKCSTGSCRYLYYASTRDYKTAKFLINHGADVNAADRVTKITPLIGAAGSNKIKIVKLLLKHGARKSINNQARRGYTALFVPAKRGYLEVVKTLIAAGANVNISDNNGQTALYAAASGGKLDVIKLLIKHGADPNIKCTDTLYFDDNKKVSPRDIAERLRYYDVVRYLDSIQ